MCWQCRPAVPADWRAATTLGDTMDRWVRRFARAASLGAILVAGSAQAAHAAGSAIYYSSQRNSPGQPNIWRMNTDGSSQEQFVAGGSEPSWSADGQKMIYLAGSSYPHCLANGSTGGGITIVGPDGQNPKNLNGTCGDARISPDGTHVAYLTGGSGAGDPVLLKVLSVANPNAPVKIVNTPNESACATGLGPKYQGACDFATEPSWIGNTALAYSNDESDFGGGIWSLPSSGTSSSPAQLAEAGPQNVMNYGIDGLAVNPSGTKMAVSTNLETNNPEDIRVIQFGGSTGSVAAAAPSGHNYRFPQWSPDGGTIVFEDVGPSGTTIDSVPAGGGAVTVLTPNDTTATDPTFGPAAPGLSLQGIVTDKAGAGLAGVRVLIAGKANDGTLVSTDETTNSSGQWSVTEPAGTYTVQPRGVPPSQPPKGVYHIRRCDGTANLRAQNMSDNCVVNGSSGAREVDFVYEPPEDHLALSFEPDHIDASSTSFADHLSTATLTVTDKDGKPVPDQTIHFRPQGDLNPPAVICDTTYTHLWPGRLASGGPDPTGFDLKTDANGQIQIQVLGGSLPGDWSLGAEEPAQSGEAQALAPSAVAHLTLTGPSPAAALPADLGTELDQHLLIGPPTGAANLPKAQQQALDVARLSGGPEITQSLVLEGLLERRAEGVLSNFEFGPTTAAKATPSISNPDLVNGGMLVWAKGQRIETALGSPQGDRTHLQVLDSAAPLLFYRPGDVIPVTQLDKLPLSIRLLTPGHRLYSRLKWWEVRDLVHQTLLQRVKPRPNEDLEFYGYAYPPPFSQAGDRASYDKCTGAPSRTDAIILHSPVRVQLRDSHGRTSGIDGHGRERLAIPGTGLFGAASGDTVLMFPPGGYSATITATGNGPATVVSFTGSGTVKAVRLKVSRGQTGAFTVGGAGLLSGRFAGRRVVVGSGVALIVRGLPGRIKAGHAAGVVIRVSDLFGAPVAGALVRVGAASVLTDRRGRARIRISRPRRGHIVVTVSAPGATTVRQRY